MINKEIIDNEDNYAFGGDLSIEKKMEIDRAFEYLQENLPRKRFEKISKITTAERKAEKIERDFKYKIEEVDEQGNLKTDSDLISSYLSEIGMVEKAYEIGMKRISYLTDKQKSNILAAYNHIQKNGAKTTQEKIFLSELGYKKQGTSSLYTFSDKGLEQINESYFQLLPDELKNLTLKFNEGESVYLKNVPEKIGTIGFMNMANGMWYVKFEDGSDGYFSEEDLKNVENKQTELKNGGTMENKENKDYTLNAIIEFEAIDKLRNAPRTDLPKVIGSDYFDLVDNELTDERDGTYNTIIKSYSVKFEGLKGSQLEEAIFDELSNGLWDYNVTVSNVRFVRDLDAEVILSDSKNFDNGGLIDVAEIEVDPANPLEEQQIQNADIGSQQYIPKSIVCESVDTVAPAAMLYEMNRSLTEIDRAVRGIDSYVMNKLGYDNLIDMCRAFSSEQVDAIANAIYQIEKGQALIVGDMTGVGKGRIAAGVMRYAMQIGKIPIFFTEKPNLFSDIYRDLIAIGSDDGIPLWFKGKEVDKIKHVTRKLIEDAIKEDIENGDFELEYNERKLFTKGYEKETNDCIEEYRELYFPSEIIKEMSYTRNDDYKKQIRNAKRLVPFIVNGRSSKTEIKDGNGNVIYEGLANTKPDYTLRKVFESGKLPKEFNAIVLTYSQVNSPSRAKEKIDWLLNIAKNNIVIMDESHNASGSSQTGRFLQGLLQSTAGVVFLSATFAKRPDNMPIYAMKTAIQDAEMDNDTLIQAIMSGGVALQEILSSELVSEGQMLRRERSYEGVVVNYNYLDERMLERDVPLPNFNLREAHEAISDVVTDIIRRIIVFQKTKVNPIIEQKDKEYAKEQVKAGVEAQNVEGGISNPPIFSGIFNLISQLLFSIKADAVAEFAITRMKEGKKVIIGFSSTLESFLDYLIQDESDKIKTDFSIILKRRLEKTLEYKTTFPNGDTEKKSLNPNDYPTITDEYYSILNDIQAASTGITISPIDAIVTKIKKAGFKIGEVTGRKKQVEFFEDGVHGAIKSRRKDNANDLFRRFNDNELDCLLINQAGATGASAQSLPTEKVNVINYNDDGTPKIPTSLEPRNEVKQRVMIILQAELDINKEVQKRGRINRTGQVFKPIYDYVISAIPAEERLMMMLQKKLKSLDANTTSNQKQSKKVLDVVDFLNVYGDEKVVEFLKDNDNYNEMIGNILKFNPDNTPSEETKMIQDKAHKVSGRVAILPVELQSNFYKTVSENYQNYETQLRQSGEWNLEVENMDLDAKMISRDVVSVGNPDKSSVFSGAVFVDKCSVNNLRKPYKKSEVENLIRSAYMFTEPNGDVIKFTAQEKSDFLIKKFLEQVEESKKSQLAYAEMRKDADLKGVKDSPSLDRKKTKEEREQYFAEKETSIEAEYKMRIESIERQAKNIKQLVVGHLEYFKVGKLVAYPLSNFDVTGDFVKGICLGVDVNFKTPNPFAPSQMSVRFILPNGMRIVKLQLSDLFIHKVKMATHNDYNIRNSDEKDLDYFIDEWDVLTKESQANRVVRYIVTGNILKGYGNDDFRRGGKLVSYTTSEGLVKKGILLPENFESKDIKVEVPINKALNYILNMRDGISVLLHGEDVYLQKRGSFHNMFVKKSKNPFVDIVNDADINSFAFTDKWDLRKGQYENKFEEPTIKKLVNILWDKYKMSVSLTVTAFESIKDQFDVQEREHKGMDGTEELIKKHNQALQEYERSKKFEELDENQFKKLDELEKENYELKKSVAELEAIRRAYKITALLDDESRKRKREAMESVSAEQMEEGGTIDSDRRFTDSDLTKLRDSGLFNIIWDVRLWIITEKNGSSIIGKFNPKTKSLFIFGKKDKTNPLVYWLQNNSFVSADEYAKLSDGGALVSEKHPDLKKGQMYTKWVDGVEHSYFIYDINNGVITIRIDGINSDYTIEDAINLIETEKLVPQYLPDTLQNGGSVGEYEKYVENIYSRQSEQPIREQLISFSRENGFDFSDEIMKGDYDTTEDEWGGTVYSKEAIRKMIGIITGKYSNSGVVEAKKSLRIRDIDGDEDYQLVTNSQDIEETYKNYAPKFLTEKHDLTDRLYSEGIGGMFIKFHDGDMEKIYVFEGDVPDRSKPLFEIYPTDEYFKLN